MTKKYISLILLLLFISFISLCSAATLTATYFPNAVAKGGGAGTTGYPYAVYVQITGFTAAANSTAYVKVYSSSTNEYMWKPTASAWSNSTTYSTSCPIVNIDASGNWSGWIYAKHNDAITGTVSVRAASTASTTTNVTSSAITVNYLTMTGTPTGGWIMRTSSPAVNKGILAYSGGAIVGTYRTEDNSVTEGYSYSAGGFKIAVPAGVIDSLVTINDDGTKDQSFPGPWIVTAGAETDASVSSSEIGHGTASIEPTKLQGDVTASMTVKIAGASPYVLTDVKVVVPELWDWSQTTLDVALVGGGSPMFEVLADTISIYSLTINAGDTLQVQLSNMVPPDTTTNFTFITKTGTHPDSIYAIGSSPTIFVYGTPKPMTFIKENDANGVAIHTGEWVTIRGVVTVANEFGGPSYMQDNTGGVAVFGSAVSANVAIGDEILVSGVVQPYAGLNEIVNPILHSILSHDNVVNPLVVTASQIANDGVGGVEQYEGLLVRLNMVTVPTTGNWAYMNYTLNDASGATEIRIDNTTNIIGTAIPGSAFDVIGVIGQYVFASPYIGGYQVMPRMTGDIIATGPIILTSPYESDMTSASFRINWTTVNDGTSRLKYGTTTSYELGTLEPDGTLRTTHAVDVAGLQAATVYHVKAFSVSGTDTSFGADLVVSTSSPAGSTGEVDVYFNKTVNTTLAYGEDALGSQDLVARLVTRINAAQYSIDAALYSFSADSYGDIVANAIVAAKNRGVKVRVICEADNRSSGGNSFDILAAAGITIITDKYDVTWNGQGLMHNKFIVIDYRGGSPENVWAITGSWNITEQGTANDRQNSIHIQDVAIAGAYTMEFNQMWGSDGDTPNATYSRFGARKLDITPHRFIVNGTPMSVYFSPSDLTTLHIQETINKAQTSVGVAMLTWTRKDLADATIAKKNAAVKTRVIMDNNTDTGNQFAYLQTNGVDVHLAGGSGLLHHKYLLVDAENPAGTPYTLTGSHNWSSSAEQSNDENTIIIQNVRVANLYLQEFAARYYEAGGTDSIRLALAPGFVLDPTSIDFDSINVGQTKQDSFTVSNTGEGSLSVTSIASSNARYSINPTSATIPSTESQTFTVTFAPTAPGLQTGNIVIIHTATGSPDTVTVTGYGIDTTTYVTVQTAMKNAWNMVSVPVTVSNARKDSVFPTAISPAWAYDAGYNYHITLVYGRGYWVKFSGDQTVDFYGTPIISSTFTLVKDWNMIGSISSPVPVASIMQTPSDNVVTSYFGYNSGYEVADTLFPGKGYWVKVAEAGTLTLTAGGSGLAKRVNPLENLNRLEVTDAAGNSQTLYFGNSPAETFSVSAYELPPVPPAGIFDARYANGAMVAIRSNEDKPAEQFPIRLQGMTLPLTVRWTVNENRANYSLVTGSATGKIYLTGNGETKISSSTAPSLALQVTDASIPEVYSLGQNFPNPFNPSTTVSFSLPQESMVNLTVYNQLGQLVYTAIGQQQIGAGYHSVMIDASSLSSGVYYYRFDARAVEDGAQFHSTKSFVVVK